MEKVKKFVLARKARGDSPAWSEDWDKEKIKTSVLDWKSELSALLFKSCGGLTCSLCVCKFRVNIVWKVLSQNLQ